MYWRSAHLFSGVSPLLPQLLLLIGAYLWTWCSLRGIAHFGDDRPLLPKSGDLPELKVDQSRMPMFSREKAGTPTEEKAIPLTNGYMVRMLVMFGITAGASAIALQGPWLRTLGGAGNLVRTSFFGSLCFRSILQIYDACVFYQQKEIDVLTQIGGWLAL